jgi:hypothetical protein
MLFPATFISPGRLLASAMSSFTEVTGRLGCTASTSGVDDIQLTGTRSLCTLNLTFFALRVTMTDRLADVKSMVLPSGGASRAS